MRHYALSIVVIVLLITTVNCTISCLPDNRTERAVIVDSIDIAPVWAGHPVAFFLLTQVPYQFIAFYDDKRQLTVGQRIVNQRTWTLNKLSDVTGWDSHDYLVMAIDDDGYLHLSGDIHAIPLKYFRTTRPLNVSTFERLDKMIGRNENQTTYPLFLRGPENELVFTYRDGVSGDGNQIYNTYHSTNRSWERLIDQPLTDGEGKRNAYFVGPIKGPDNYFHLAWVWRESPDASTNHDLSYARSKDLINWETGAGNRPLKLPIKLEECDIVDPVPQKGGIINGNTKVGFDDQGRVTITYHKNDANNYTQPWTARLENGKWQRYQITNWPWHWDFGGGGTLVFAITIGPITKENDGCFTQTYYHLKFGNGTWLIDPMTLSAVGKLQRFPIPSEFYRIEGNFTGLSFRVVEDSGRTDMLDSRYVLRWETLSSKQGSASSTTMAFTINVTIIYFEK